MNTNMTVAPEFEIVEDTRAVRDPGTPSIRAICLMGIANGLNTPSIAATIKKYHPTSMAAEKASKHIAYYRSWAKKNGNPYAQTA